MQRLSGLDAAFLALETPSAHMHVLGVAVVDPSTAPEPWSCDSVRALLEARLPALPPLRRRLVEVPFGVANPIWVSDPSFDLDFHLRRAALPAPGGPSELAAFVADVASRPIDRARPLWEAWVVEGLEHGHSAFVAKLHHSLIDGASGVEILAKLFDMSSDAPLVPEELPDDDDWQYERVPGEIEMLVRAGVSIAQKPAYFVRALNNLGRGVTRAVRRARDNELDVTLPLTAPKLTINRPITPHRKVAFSSVPLAQIKAVKNALGVTVNDVVLAVAAGALRDYLIRRDELPEQSLVAAIPTSERDESDSKSFGNRVSAMFASLPVEIADPAERVAAVQRSTSGAKQMHESVGGSTLQEWAEVSAPVLFNRAIRIYARLRVAERVRPVINIIVSNVPGPPFPLYLAGAQLVALHPLGPIFDDCGLNLTVISYLDHVDFGFIGCRELVPDLDDLAAAVPDALHELSKLTG